MMNIIASSRLRGEDFEYNTFIKGMSDFLLTKQDLADKTSLSVNEIDLFENNLETKASINKDYNSFFSPRFIPENNNLKAYIDLGGFLKSTGNDAFFGGFNEGRTNPFYLLNSLQNIANRCFENNNSIIGSFHSVTTIGSTAFDQGTNGEIYVDKSLKTADNGSPLPALVTFVNNGGIIIYRDSNDINQTTSPPVSTISTNVIGGTFVELNVPQPTHVNILKYVLVFVDGFFQDVYDINSEIYILNLQEQKSYHIKVIIADEYFNISTYSNTINVTTTTINTAALFQNAVAYYKLDGTSGNVIDAVNGYNGTLFGGVTQGVAGKIGTAIESDGVGDKYFEVPTQAFDENDFHTAGWFYYDSTNNNKLQMICRGNNNKGFFVVIDSQISFSYFGVGPLPKVSSNAVDNDWNHYVISKIGGNIKIYINNVLLYNETETYFIGGTALRYGIVVNTYGSVLAGSAVPFKLDEIDHRTTPYTVSEISDLYNNGIGITI